ncbi:hypothetical protein GCM10011492_03680 [Flexivirga endophytica]|uniref:Endonuclease/exonuclease/phosphatase domain-containing protein n=1 Tax=Flexivirga endophytica TaxID=1849103 RepID=A0A916WMS7_9MICO|nr:hypothetical protein GCM10011492_03680 [Flexivirga endophytica]GHB38434.1 hypothetical protein GCM10008112_03930 [Flexivirga endophytica]
MLVVLQVLIGLGVAVRWLDATWQVPIVQAFFPVIGMAAVAMFVLVAALRYRVLGLCALLVAVPPLVLGMTSLHSDTVAAGPHDEVVMTINLEYGHADPARVVAAARERRVDTLVLEECTPSELRALRRHGLDDLLPHQAGSAGPGLTGTLVRSTHRVRLVAEHSAGRFAGSPDIQVVTAQGDYRLRAVHTPAPLPDIVGDWRSALRSLTAWRDRLPDDQRLVLAGDFNASSAMPGYRKLADGLTDSSRATGSGWQRTWPHGTWLPPFVQLDHVLSRGFAVVADGTVPIAGTDHLGYWARLRMQRAE